MNNQSNIHVFRGGVFRTNYPTPGNLPTSSHRPIQMPQNVRPGSPFQLQIFPSPSGPYNTVMFSNNQPFSSPSTIQRRVDRQFDYIRWNDVLDVRLNTARRLGGLDPLLYGESFQVDKALTELADIVPKMDYRGLIRGLYSTSEILSREKHSKDVRLETLLLLTKSVTKIPPEQLNEESRTKITVIMNQITDIFMLAYNPDPEVVFVTVCREEETVDGSSGYTGGPTSRKCINHVDSNLPKGLLDNFVNTLNSWLERSLKGPQNVVQHALKLSMLETAQNAKSINFWDKAGDIHLDLLLIASGIANSSYVEIRQKIEDLIQNKLSCKESVIVLKKFDPGVRGNKEHLTVAQIFIDIQNARFLNYEFCFEAVDFLNNVCQFGATPQIRSQAENGISWQGGQVPGLRSFKNIQNLQSDRDWSNFRNDLRIPGHLDRNTAIQTMCSEYLKKLSTK